MALQFCKYYPSYSLVLALLLLLSNRDNLILKLHQKKLATFMKGSFKVESVPVMINKKKVLLEKINLEKFLIYVY